MNNGFYYDRNDDLWYYEDGEAQAVDWEEGFGPLVPETALRVLFGPMQRVKETTTW